VLKALRDDNIANMELLIIFEVVSNKWMNCCLRVIPVKALDSILNNKRVVF